jgi:hypothetical protein
MMSRMASGGQLPLWVSGGIGRIHRPSGVPPTAATLLHRRELALGATSDRPRLFHEAAETVGIKKSVTLLALRHNSGNAIIPPTEPIRAHVPRNLALAGTYVAE